MPEPSSDRDTSDDDGARSRRGAATGRPRWQKTAGIIGILIVLGLGILLFAGGGHGPGRHGPGGEDPPVDAPGGQAPVDGDHAPPEGHAPPQG